MSLNLNQGLFKAFIAVSFRFCVFFSVLGLGSTLMAQEAEHGHEDTEVLALKYKGFILNKDPKAVAKSCEFFISTDVLMYGSLVDGEILPAVTPIPLYYNSALPLGSRYYPITEPQGEGVLAFAFIELNSNGLSAGILPDPNNITDLISKKQVEISMILILKQGVSFEDFNLSVSKVLQDSLEIPNQKRILDLVDTLNLSLWHMGHYDIPRCVSSGFDSVQMIDLNSSEDHHEDSSVHNHDVESGDESGHDHSHEDADHGHEHHSEHSLEEGPEDDGHDH